MSGQQIDISEQQLVAKARNECWITISETSIHVHWDKPLPDGPHRPTRIETMAAGALLGIARTLTGRGEEAVIDAMAQFERKRKAAR